MWCFVVGGAPKKNTQPRIFEKILYFGLKVRAKWD
jgi:hypothetical protein